MSFRFQKVVIGGTFDLLHLGHQKLLQTAFSEGKFVSIGLTTDTFNNSRSKKTFQKYPARRKKLTDYLEKAGFSNRYKIIPINDIFGNSHTDPQLEAIIVTPETVANAKLINKKRSQQTLPWLETIIINHVKDETGTIISSTRIRNGEIDDRGRIFLNFLLSISNITLSEKIKNRLRKPLGNLIHNLPKKHSQPFITIGDITTRQFLLNQKTPFISIIDLKTNRKTHFKHITELGFKQNQPDVLINNPAGQITSKLITTLQKALYQDKPSILQIVGEEDLAVLPSIMLSPLGTKVYYGQPGEGIVEVNVNLEMKEKIWTILKLLRK